MNTANLQLEGVCVALSALLDALRRKGALSADEIETALAGAEEAVATDRFRPDELSGSNVEAIRFPIRYLRAANQRPEGSDVPAFSDVATAIGLAKRARRADRGA